MRTLEKILILLSLSTNVFGQRTDSKLRISRLTGGFYVFTTYNSFQGKRIPANGMYLVTNQGVIMFDTPWDTTQFQPLLDSIKNRHHKEVCLCIATHFHADRTGGLEYYRKQGIKTYTTKQTDNWCVRRKMPRAQFLIDKDTVFNVGQYSFQTYYPGPGHTADNIIIWFEKEKILYGGCLIKSAEDDNLGNLSDANVKEYSTTIKHVMAKCNKPQYIIPGHGEWTDTTSLSHTLEMAEKLR